MVRDPDSILITNPGSNLYGSDRMTVETAKALIARGFRVTVTTPDSGPLVRLLKDAGATVIQQGTPVIRKSSLSPRGMLRLAIDAVTSVVSSWRLLRRVGAATVLVNTITTPLWFPVARLAGTRVACHLHEAEASVRAPVRWAMYAPLHFCQRVIANSTYTAHVLSDSSRGLGGRVRVVHNTVPGPEKVVAPRPSLGDEVRLLYVGRLSRRKGPDVVVEALSLLREGGTRAHLDIVGDVFPGNESYETELRNLIARRGLLQQIELHGFQSEVWPHIADCDVVVVPSVGEESFGNTAVEAALAARPVVVSDIAGLREATSASESAIRVPPGNPEAVRQAIETMVQDWDGYCASAVADSTRVASKFSATVYANALIAALSLKNPGPTT